MINDGARGRAAGEHVGLVVQPTSRQMLDGLFTTRIVNEGLFVVREDGWTTDAPELDVPGAERLVEVSLMREPLASTQFRIGAAVAQVTLRQRNVSAVVAAADAEAVDNALAQLRAALPEVQLESKHEAEFTFWWIGPHGSCSMARPLPVPSWVDVRANYARETATSLSEVLTGGRRAEAGKLLLWHGVPGTGKTHAIRTLAWEWRAWCQFHYITDPERLSATGDTWWTSSWAGLCSLEPNRSTEWAGAVSSSRTPASCSPRMRAQREARRCRGF